MKAILFFPTILLFGPLFTNAVHGFFPWGKGGKEVLLSWPHRAIEGLASALLLAWLFLP